MGRLPMPRKYNRRKYREAFRGDRFPRDPWSGINGSVMNANGSIRRALQLTSDHGHQPCGTQQESSFSSVRARAIRG